MESRKERRARERKERKKSAKSKKDQPKRSSIILPLCLAAGIAGVGTAVFYQYATTEVQRRISADPYPIAYSDIKPQIYICGFSHGGNLKLDIVRSELVRRHSLRVAATLESLLLDDFDEIFLEGSNENDVVNMRAGDTNFSFAVGGQKAGDETEADIYLKQVLGLILSSRFSINAYESAALQKEGRDYTAPIDAIQQKWEERALQEYEESLKSSPTEEQRYNKARQLMMRDKEPMWSEIREYMDGQGGAERYFELFFTRRDDFGEGQIEARLEEGSNIVVLAGTSHARSLHDRFKKKGIPHAVITKDGQIPNNLTAQELYESAIRIRKIIIDP